MNLIAQDSLTLESIDSTSYREDHIYMGITYNILLERPSGISQNNLPYGIQLGYIRDIPINKARNFGFGIGLGYALNNYFTNLQAAETLDGISYAAIPDDVSFKRNKIETHLLEMPLEVRWRTSTSTNYKFWRIYGGVKLGYIFANASKFVGDGGKLKFSNDDLRKFQTDIYFSFGYNTWNFYASYGLNRIFKPEVDTISGEQLEMKVLKAGLVFYLL
ncbi:porin family protein [Ascidiimonas sp. W6]|uniref:porin family protein n=1 Tax=Ascidiimonas meishanensis TaxID=3128903 RepID=UPI0030EC2F1D